MQLRCSFTPDLAAPYSRPRGFERYAQDSPPEALLIACTDPILDASLLAQFRSAPVLVWRNTGPVVPPYGAGHRDIEGAIEQAVAELGVKEIAICGHLPGEPLQAFLGDEASPEGTADDPFSYYARFTRRIVQEKYGGLSPEELHRAMVEENVFVQMANLRTHPAVLAGLARSRLKLHSWIYDAHRDELFGHAPSQSPLLKWLKRQKRPAQCLLPYLDPCDIYLA